MRKLVPQTSALTGLRYAPTEKAFSHQDLASNAGQGSNAEPGTERTQDAYTGPQSPGQVPKSFLDGSAPPCLHFVWFRGDEYTRACLIFGRPDFIHIGWDQRARRDIGPGDVIVFARGEHDQPPRERNFPDIVEAENG